MCVCLRLLRYTNPLLTEAEAEWHVQPFQPYADESASRKQTIKFVTWIKVYPTRPTVYSLCVVLPTASLFHSAHHSIRIKSTRIATAAFESRCMPCAFYYVAWCVAVPPSLRLYTNYMRPIIPFRCSETRVYTIFFFYYRSCALWAIEKSTLVRTDVSGRVKRVRFWFIFPVARVRNATHTDIFLTFNDTRRQPARWCCTWHLIRVTFSVKRLNLGQSDDVRRKTNL